MSDTPLTELQAAPNFTPSSPRERRCSERRPGVVKRTPKLRCRLIFLPKRLLNTCEKWCIRAFYPILDFFQSGLWPDR